MDKGIESLAENESYVVVSDETGAVMCYERFGGDRLWEYQRAAKESGKAKATSVSLFGPYVFALYDDRMVFRFSAETGEVEGALETNYVPKRAVFSPSGGTLFAVYGEVGAKRDVYLLRTDFGGTEEAPASYRAFPKLDSGDYAVSSGGVETGVQGILITADENIYIASDAYSVRVFTANGMADGYREFSIAAEKLSAFCKTDDGFAGFGSDGVYYRFDEEFVCRTSMRYAQSFTVAVCAGDTLYGTDGNSVIALTKEGEKLFSLPCAGESLLFAGPDSFVLAGEGLRWLTLTNGQGGGLRIRCDSPLHFDAHHNAVAEYQSAQHDHELPVHAETWLHLDAAHSPIGSDLAWSTAMPEEQALRGGGYHLGFTLEPLV